jgi:hypothetical protein
VGGSRNSSEQIGSKAFGMTAVPSTETLRTAAHGTGHALHRRDRDCGGGGDQRSVNRIPRLLSLPWRPPSWRQSARNVLVGPLRGGHSPERGSGEKSDGDKRDAPNRPWLHLTFSDEGFRHRQSQRSHRVGLTWRKPRWQAARGLASAPSAAVHRRLGEQRTEI